MLLLGSEPCFANICCVSIPSILSRKRKTSPSPRSAGAVLQAGTPGIKNTLTILTKKAEQVQRQMKLRRFSLFIDTLSVWKEPYLFFFLYSRIQFAAHATFSCDRLECLLFLCGFLAPSPG